MSATDLLLWLIAALLVRLGVLEADHKLTRKRLNPIQKNWRGKETGVLKSLL